MSNSTKNFAILTTSLNVLHNYFDSSIKLFSDLYLAKFLDTSIKPFLSVHDKFCVTIILLSNYGRTRFDVLRCVIQSFAKLFYVRSDQSHK